MTGSSWSGLGTPTIWIDLRSPEKSHLKSGPLPNFSHSPCLTVPLPTVHWLRCSGSERCFDGSGGGDFVGVFADSWPGDSGCVSACACAWFLKDARGYGAGTWTHKGRRDICSISLPPVINTS